MVGHLFVQLVGQYEMQIYTLGIRNFVIARF